MALLEDLLNMATELETALKAKEFELRDNDNSHLWGKVKNIKSRISGLRNSINLIPNDPTLKDTIFRNFSNDKEKILKEIQTVNT